MIRSIIRPGQFVLRQMFRELRPLDSCEFAQYILSNYVVYMYSCCRGKSLVRRDAPLTDDHIDGGPLMA